VETDADAMKRDFTNRLADQLATKLPHDVVIKVVERFWAVHNATIKGLSLDDMDDLAKFWI